MRSGIRTGAYIFYSILTFFINKISMERISVHGLFAPTRLYELRKEYENENSFVKRFDPIVNFFTFILLYKVGEAGVRSTIDSCKCCSNTTIFTGKKNETKAFYFYPKIIVINNINR
jgi:hypothetical protein